MYPTDVVCEELLSSENLSEIPIIPWASEGPRNLCYYPHCLAKHLGIEITTQYFPNK